MKNKTQNKLTLSAKSLAIIFSIGVLGQFTHANQKCVVLLSNQSSNSSIGTSNWLRAADTNTFGQNGSIAPTSPDREKWMEKTKETMFEYIKSQKDTPQMVFVHAEGVTFVIDKSTLKKPESYSIPLNYTNKKSEQAYHQDKVMTMKFSGLGPSGILKGTLLLPVSGHTSFADATSWSKTDKYSVIIEDANGRSLNVLVDNAPSKNYITAQEVEIKLDPSAPTRLTYHRGGSGGPADYPDGRIINLEWDGK